MKVHSARFASIASTLLLFASAAVASAPTIQLVAVDHPQGDTTVTHFERWDAAPEAKMIAETDYRDGKTHIAIVYDGMRPAALFGGDVTAFVLWAVSPDGSVDNLGELTIRGDDDGRQDYSTALKEFALIVTGEPYYLVSQPSGLVLFHTGPTDEKDARNDLFTFSGFADAPRHDLSSLAAAERKLKTPGDLLQARKALELAERRDADVVAPTEMDEARNALADAERLNESGKDGRLFRDTSRRSIAHSHQAITRSIEQARAAEELSEELEVVAAKAQAAGAQERAAAAESEAMRAQRRAAAAEAAEARRRAQMNEAELARERAEQQQVETRLHAALSEVIETRRTARGLVLNVPDILFEIDEAELTPDAREQLAKVAGILSVDDDIALEVEGHADETGEADYNMDLSRDRAKAVRNLLTTHGVDAERISVEAFGESQPVADNATAEGRRKNRRVEIVVLTTTS